MTDEHRFVSAGAAAGIGDSRTHAGGDILVRLTQEGRAGSTGAARPGLAQDAVTHRHPLALEDVGLPR